MSNRPRLCDCGKEPITRSTVVPGAAEGTQEHQVWVACTRCGAEGEPYTGLYPEPAEAVGNWNSYILSRTGSPPIASEDVAG